MSILNLILAFFMFSQPQLYVDGKRIVNEHIEYAVGYNVDGSETFVATGQNGVFIRPYYTLLDNGGRVLHNHPAGNCPGLSYEDLIVAAGLNLSEMVSVTPYQGHIVYRFAIRRITGWWGPISRLEMLTVNNKYLAKYDVCEAWDKMLEELAPKYGFIYWRVDHGRSY